MFTKETITIKGVSPLLMHDKKTVDPMHPMAKALKKLTSNRNKTDEHLQDIKKLEWMAGLYTDENDRPTIPAEVLESAIVAGSKKSKNGPKFKASFFVDEVHELKTNEKGTPEEIYKRGTAVDYRPVTVSRSKVMRARPIFRDWECTFTVAYDTDQINREEVIKAIEDAGQQCGIGDWRPKHGRFEVVN